MPFSRRSSTLTSPPRSSISLSTPPIRPNHAADGGSVSSSSRWARRAATDSSARRSNASSLRSLISPPSRRLKGQGEYRLLRERSSPYLCERSRHRCPGRQPPAWGWIVIERGLDKSLFDVKIDSEQDEWPEHDAEHGRDDWLDPVEVLEVVMRVRNDQTHNDVDRGEQLSNH